MDDGLTFQLEVTVQEVSGLKSVTGSNIVYCTIDVVGQHKLQTDHVEAAKPKWNTKGEYTLSHPLPVVKLKLYAENAGMLALDDKEIGKVVINPSPITCQYPEWHKMIVPKNSVDKDLKIKVICSLECTSVLKHCGYLYAAGKKTWKKWKKRYSVLYDVTEQLYALVGFKEKKSESNESIVLDGYTIDYIEQDKAKQMMGIELKGGKFFFSATKEGDIVLFATDEEKECRAWVTALFKVSGQTDKPVPPASHMACRANNKRISDVGLQGANSSKTSSNASTPSPSTPLVAKR